jgi:hypothetical protein
VTTQCRGKQEFSLEITPLILDQKVKSFVEAEEVVAEGETTGGITSVNGVVSVGVMVLGI